MSYPNEAVEILKDTIRHQAEQIKAKDELIEHLENQIGGLSSDIQRLEAAPKGCD